MDGEKLILACQVHAAPLPKVQWYHNEQLIVETKDKQFQQDSSGRCVLTVSEVFPEDTGEYACIASNKLGEAICKTTVNVEPFEYVPDSEQFRSSEEDLLTDKVRVGGREVRQNLNMYYHFCSLSQHWRNTPNR